MLIIFEVQIELSIIRLDGLFERLEQVMDVIHGERRLTKDTHDFEDRPANLEVVLDNGNEAVGDDGFRPRNHRQDHAHVLHRRHGNSERGIVFSGQ